MAKNKPISGKDKEVDEKSGFGMSYKVLPMFGAIQERVSVYLQYLADTDNNTIDATFDLRLKGQQSAERKFDVEYSAGMRFMKEGKLQAAQGHHLDASHRLRIHYTRKQLTVEIAERFAEALPLDRMRVDLQHVALQGQDENLPALADVHGPSRID